MSAAQTGTALAAYGINLVDEDDGRGDLFGLVKQVTDTAGTDTYIHFYKIRTGDGQKLYTGFPGCGTGQQGLTGTGRAYQQ